MGTVCRCVVRGPGLPGAGAGQCRGGGAARGLPGAVGEKPPFWKQRAPGPDGITLPWGQTEAGFGVLGDGGGRGALDKAWGLSGQCVSVGAFPLY